MDYITAISHISKKLRDDPANPSFTNTDILNAIHRAIWNFHTWATQAERFVEDLGPLNFYLAEIQWGVKWDWINGVWGSVLGQKVEMASYNPANNTVGLPPSLSAVYSCRPNEAEKNSNGYILPKYRLVLLTDNTANPQTPVYALRWDDKIEGAPNTGSILVRLVYIRQPKISTILSDIIDIPEPYSGALIDAVVADLKGTVGEIPEPFTFRHKEVEARIPPELPGGPVS